MHKEKFQDQTAFRLEEIMVATKGKVRKFAAQGNRLKDLRDGLSLSQIDLLELLKQYGIDTTQSHLSNLENGFLLPRPRLSLALAKVLNTNSAYLLGEIDDSKPLNEAEVDTISEEAEVIARLVDEMPIYQRKLSLAIIKTIANVESEEQRTRLERWERLIALVEGIAGKDVRRDVESAAIKFALL